MDVADPRAARFRRAVLERSVDRLAEAFRAHPELVDVIDEPWFHFDAPALVQAAGYRDRALVDALLDLGADIDARSAWEPGPYSALHGLVDGATEESLALAEHLVARGARVDLHAAAGLGRADVIADILDAAPDRVSEPGPDGATPLHLARTVAIAALLLERGADIDKRCVDHSSTPAMWAAGGREEVMRFLLERGARPDLYMAVLLDDADLAARILEREPSAIDVRVAPGRSHEHLGFGDKYVWALGGPDTPIELARVRGRPATYALLLERSSDAVRLVQASRRGDAEEIDRLFEGDAELLGRLSERDVCDALCGHAEGTRALLRHGADPNARDDASAATALHHAAWRGLVDVAAALLDGGADPGLRDRDYDATPLGWANENGQRAVMDVLLERHPPDIVDAAWLGDADRVRAILAERPALADGLDGGRISPLRTAAWCGKADVVRVLLEHGADPAATHPTSGKRAADLARERGHTEIVGLLEGAPGR